MVDGSLAKSTANVKVYSEEVNEGISARSYRRQYKILISTFRNISALRAFLSYDRGEKLHWHHSVLAGPLLTAVQTSFGGASRSRWKTCNVDIQIHVDLVRNILSDYLL